jgi:hypothetical protein
MKKTSISNLVLLVLALLLSLFLAIGGYTIYDKFAISTPGVIAARALVAPNPRDLIGSKLEMQIIVDWAFWFAVFCVVYFPLRRRLRRSKGQQ